MSESITYIIDPSVFNAYARCVGILSIKMLGVTFWTVRTRLTKKIFANSEDTVGIHTDKTKAIVKLDDPDIERLRRIHLNDVENIPLFFAVGGVYMLMGPSAPIAIWHFRIFTIARILHTFIYLLQIPQPARAFVFYAGGFGATLSMAAQILYKIGLFDF